MANEELGKLSPEQIQKLATAISDAKNLTNQQADIIESVLKGEEDIGKRRISYLKEYFDTYSKNLDLVAKKYATTAKEAKELGGARADRVNKEAEEKALHKIRLELEAKRRELEFAEREKHNGKLTKKAATEIEKQLAREYEIKTKNINKLTSEQLKRDQQVAAQRLKAEERIKALAELKEADPRLVETFEKKRADRRAELELEAIRRNNGIINQETRTAINNQLDEEFNVKSDRGKALLQELAAKRLEDENKEQEKRLQAIASEQFKNNDPGLWQEREAAMRREIADLELQYRLDNNNKLDEETRKKIKKQVEEKYAFESEAVGELAKEYAKKLKEEQLKKDNPKLAQAREEQKGKRLAELEYAARLENDGLLTEEKEKAIKKQVEAEFELTEDNLKRIEALRRKNDAKKFKEEEEARIAKEKKEEQDRKEKRKKQAADILTGGPLFGEHGIKARYNQFIEDEVARAEAEGLDPEQARMQAQTDALLSACASLNKLLENSIDKIAESKGEIDTRLQGSNNEKFAGSYWDQLTKDMMSVGAVTPFFKQENFANNIKSLVDRGISFDLKQRAFLMTIQEKIANTFNVADGTLLRLIRIQQEDSTAGRLGMESALNTFLNEMYENTEYLKGVAESVRGSLQEMEALMTGAEATEVEYQVQKWMGSLYSVGMSQEAVQGIAGALGQLAAGQIEAISGSSGAGNLLVMAANDAGIPISNILANGLNAEETNKLLQATVNYLAEIAESSKGNNVVQQQLAGVFGVKASDLRAATNLVTKDSVDDIFGEQLSYDNMLRQLYKMAATMGMRTSIGEQLSNIWANGQYSIAGSMASTPMSYLLHKASRLLKDTTGGMDFGIPLIMGNGLPINFNVADLMSFGAIGSGILGSLGPMINGLATSSNGALMLASMGIDFGSGLKATPRGTTSGIGASAAGGGTKTTSGSGYIGNASGSDIKNSTIQKTEDDADKQMIEAQEEARATQIDFINTNVLKIYELLDEVATGKRSLNVRVSGYGLTSPSRSTSIGGVQGGTDRVQSSSTTGNNGTLGGGFNNTTGTGSSGVGIINSNGSATRGDTAGGTVSIDLGGWTMR
jgi:hypothetical protein